MLAEASKSSSSPASAFRRAMVSFLSPCVLPLVPAYLGYLSGATLGGQVVASGEPATV